MGKKNVSDTLSQQRKAREDFLALKKMQSGEITPEPKPSEVAVLPKTFEDKLKNYWFHYKWHTIAAIFITIFLAITVTQCAKRTDYDMKVVYFTYNPVTDDMLTPVGDYLESFCSDLNGNGKVEIQVINCSISKENLKNQYGMTTLQKVQSLIVGESEALLYITDSESAEYFNNDSFSDLFDTEPLKLNEEFYTATKTEQFGQLPDGLQIACRRVAETTIENQKNVGKIEKESLKILSQLEKK